MLYRRSILARGPGARALPRAEAVRPHQAGAVVEGGYSPSDAPLPRGEVHIGGPALADGYHDTEEATAADFYTDVEGVATMEPRCLKGAELCRPRCVACHATSRLAPPPTAPPLSADSHAAGTLGSPSVCGLCLHVGLGRKGGATRLVCLALSFYVTPHAGPSRQARASEARKDFGTTARGKAGV